MSEVLSAPWAGWLLLAAFTGLSLAVLTERLTRKAKEDQALREAARRLRRPPE